MGDHVDHGAGGGDPAADEDPQHHEAEVADRGVGDESVEVVLADGGQPPVDDPDDGRHEQDRGGPGGRLGEERQDQGDHAVGADLVQDSDQEDRGARRGLLGGVGQPGVHRDHGGLDGECDHEGHEDPAGRRRRGGQGPGQGLDEVAGRSVRAVEEQGDHADEHDQPAGQRVQEELQGGALAVRPAEAADEEVHRDEHGLEAHVEQEHVARAEDDDHEGLQHQHQRREGALAVGGHLAPAGEQDDGHEEGCQQQHGQAEAVDAQGPGDAQGGDPRAGLGELGGGGAARVEQGQRPDADAERAQGEDEADAAGQAAQRGQEPQEQRPGERDEHHDGQHWGRSGDGFGDGLHVVVSSQNLLARTAMRASTVPASM